MPLVGSCRFLSVIRATPSPGISPAKKRIRYRSVSNFNAEYTRTFDWVMASDQGKQQAYCKVCSKHFSVSHDGIVDVCRHGETDFLKKSRIFRALSRIFFFQKLNMSGSIPIFLYNDSVKVAKIRHVFVKLQRIVFTKVSLFLQINGKKNTTFQF